MKGIIIGDHKFYFDLISIILTYFMHNDSPMDISVNFRVVFLPIGNIFLLVSTMDIEEHEEKIAVHVLQMWLRRKNMYI